MLLNLFCAFTAQLLAATSSHSADYSDALREQIQRNLLSLCIISIICILWTFFIVIYSSKKWRYMPHSQTMMLLVFQALQCIGVLLYNSMDFSMEWPRYIQVLVQIIGSYGSRINACVIALTVLMLTKGKSRIVSKFQTSLLAFGSLSPIVIVVILIFGVPGEIHEANPAKEHTDNTFGFSQIMTTATIYVVSLVIVISCLIISQMHYKRRQPEINKNGSKVGSRKIKDGQSVLAVGKKVSDILGFNDALPEGAALEDCCQWKDGRKRSKNERDCQMVRHTVLLLYQAVLMFVGKYE